jgi:hypothetical protein
MNENNTESVKEYGPYCGTFDPVVEKTYMMHTDLESGKLVYTKENPEDDELVRNKILSLQKENKKLHEMLTEAKSITLDSDGFYKKYVPCKVLNKYYKPGFFTRKYYFTIEICGDVQDIRVNAKNFYKDFEMDKILMKSEDQKTWYIAYN